MKKIQKTKATGKAAELVKKAQAAGPDKQDLIEDARDAMAAARMAKAMMGYVTSEVWPLSRIGKAASRFEGHAMQLEQEAHAIMMLLETEKII